MRATEREAMRVRAAVIVRFAWCSKDVVFLFGGACRFSLVSFVVASFKAEGFCRLAVCDVWILDPSMRTPAFKPVSNFEIQIVRRHHS